MSAIRKTMLVIVALLLTVGPSAGAFQSASPVDIVVAYKDYVNAPVKGVKGACSNCFPVEGASVTLTYGGVPHNGTTGADGHVVFSVPLTVTSADLEVDATSQGFVLYQQSGITVEHRRPTDRWAVLLVKP